MCSEGHIFRGGKWVSCHYNSANLYASTGAFTVCTLSAFG